MKSTISELLKSLLVPILLLPTTMWAASHLWRMLRDQTSDTTQSRVVGLLLFAACASLFYASKFYAEISPVRRDQRLRRKHTHSAETDISSDKDGVRVCTKCLQAVPAKAYPLHSKYGYGTWDCSGCGQSYMDEKRLEKERARLAERATNPPQRSSAFSA